MKTKIKKPAELEGLNESAYSNKLKADFGALELAEPSTPILFLFRSEYSFKDGMNPLFIAGITSDWKKQIKAQGWLKSPEAKQTWLGFCERKGEVMNLTVKKGKLTQPIFHKAIKQNSVLKKFEWNIVEAIDDTDDDSLLVETADEETENPAASNPAAQASIPNPDVQTANRIIKELLTLLPTLNGGKNSEALAQARTLTKALTAIPNWKDYTPDNLEKILEKIAPAPAPASAPTVSASSNTEDENQAKAHTKQILAFFAELKTTDSKHQVLKKLQTEYQALQKIAKWQDYVDDKIEGALTESTQMLQKVENVLAPYENKIKACATIEQLEIEISAIPNTNPLLKKYAEEVKADLEHIKATNQYVNDCLDAQEGANKRLAETKDPEEQAALRTFLEALEAEIKKLLN